MKKVIIIFGLVLIFISFVVGLMIYYQSQTIKMQETKEINVIKQQQAKEENILRLQSDQKIKEAEATPRAYDECVEAARFDFLDKKVAIGVMSPSYTANAKYSTMPDSNPAQTLKNEMNYVMTIGICKDVPNITEKECQILIDQKVKPIREALDQARSDCAQRYIK